MKRLCRALWAMSLTLQLCLHTEATAESKREMLDTVRVEQAQLGPEGTVFGIWVGESSGSATYEHNAQKPMPAASSIKSAILVELFAKYEGRLESSIEASSAVFADDDHPAFSHYSAQWREQCQQALREASVYDIGAIMIGTKDASNQVYNGAANLSMALLGGPREATGLMHARDPAFAGLTLNRYMLADRNERGDNTATPASLAEVYRLLASGKMPGLSRETIERVKSALLADAEEPRHYFKHGALQTDPMASIRSGWYEQDDRRLVYVVMGSAPAPKQATEVASAYGKLDSAVEAIADFAREAWLP